MTELGITTSFRADVQRLRGIAILFVVAYHSGGLLPGGFVGVDAFFVISGYVIVRSVLAEKSDQAFTLRNFLFRRVRRIVPALALMLTIVIGLSSWLTSLSSRVQTVRTGLFATFGLSNGFLYRFRPDGYFDQAEKNNALLHTWSLGIEEQMYLAVGLIATASVFIRRRRLGRPRNCGALSLAAIAVASFTICMILSYREILVESESLRKLLGTDTLDSRFAFYFPFTRAWQFLAGALVALSGSLIPGSSWGRPFRILGVSFLFISSFATSSDNFPNVWSFVPVLGTTLILIAPAIEQAKIRGISRLLSYLGDRSYSWYLWHWPLLQFVSPFNASRVTLLTTSLVALVPAELSYRFVEQPIRHGALWRKPANTLKLFAVCLLVPVSAAATTRNPHPELGHHLDVELDCVYGEIAKLGPGGPCIRAVPDSQGIAALIGDSHASHLSEAFVSAAHDLGLDAMLASHANRPFLFSEGVTEGGNSDRERQLVSHLIASDVKLVVLAQASYPTRFLSGKSWFDGMFPLLKSLTESGIKVVLVAESANVGVDPIECSAIQIAFSRCPADITRLTSQLKANRGRILDEKRVVNEFRGVVVFDWIDQICPDSTCSIYRDGRWLWRDNGHLSVHASQLLTEPLGNAMQLALAN